MTQSTEAMRLTDDEAYVTHLLSCALTGAVPLPLPGGASWEGAFRLAAANSVTSTCAFAVSRVPGVTPGEVSRWKAQVDANLMRLALFDVEREAIFQKMNEAGISRLPLKGLVVGREYPRPEMRWMCDNDILCGRVELLLRGGYVAVDADEAALELRRIMEGLGYEAEGFGAGNCDNYLKPPIFNMEMHRQLAVPEVDWWKYYQNSWLRARPAREGSLDFELSREDTYVYHIAHMSKHFEAGGHGVRGIADQWVLMQAWDAQMDHAYVAAQLRELGMIDFEQSLRALAVAVVGKDACGRVLGGNASGMSGELWQMLAYMLESGTYGTLQNQVTNRLRQEAELDLGRGPRMRYVLHRVFPPLKKLQLGYPALKRHPWLLPAVYAYRIVVRPFVNGRRLRAELRVLKDADR